MVVLINLLAIYTRVAMFFLIQNTKTRANVPKGLKIYQLALKYQNDIKTPKVSISRPSKYTNYREFWDANI
jgi:hypothetical protein